jgi:hypothetical protein
MNERIRQLAEQAEKYANEQAHRAWHHSSGFNPFKDKFAELIVAESYNALQPMLRDMISRGHAYDLIKQHFGVEE